MLETYRWKIQMQMPVWRAMVRSRTGMVVDPPPPGPPLPAPPKLEVQRDEPVVYSVLGGSITYYHESRNEFNAICNRCLR
eukprot:931520-Pyramimonas_sp.AAC.1